MKSSKNDEAAVNRKSVIAVERAEKKIEAKLKKKTKGFWVEFKKFITKGNIVDLAVAMIIGVAFNDIVKGLVNYLITPVTSFIIGIGVDLTDLKLVLREAVPATETEAAVSEIAIMYGTFIQTVINFFIIALSVFIALKVYMNAMKLFNRREEAKRKSEEAKKKAEEAKKATEAKAKLEADEAAQRQFYRDSAEQTRLMREIREYLANQNKED